MDKGIEALIADMKAAAEKATPGQWVYLPKNTSIEYDVGSDDHQGSITYMDSGDFTQKITDLNGAHVAAANPENVLKLIAALEQAQAQSSKWLEAYHKAVSVVARYEERISELESSPNGMMQLSNELAEMKRKCVELTVWYGAMPESNGKTNWTAILHRKGEGRLDGMTIGCSEYPGRVLYAADRVRYLIGEKAERPHILDYDADKHSGYTARKEYL